MPKDAAGRVPPAERQDDVWGATGLLVGVWGALRARAGTAGDGRGRRSRRETLVVRDESSERGQGLELVGKDAVAWN